MAECEPAFREAKVRPGVLGGWRFSAACASCASCWQRAVQQAGQLSQRPGKQPVTISDLAWVSDSPDLPTPYPQVVDAAVLRFPRAVTHFSPGSAKWRPTQACAAGRGEALDVCAACLVASSIVTLPFTRAIQTPAHLCAVHILQRKHTGTLHTRTLPAALPLIPPSSSPWRPAGDELWQPVAGGRLGEGRAARRQRAVAGKPAAAVVLHAPSRLCMP